MRKGGGKQKGSAFEREICKTLSLWLTNNERDDTLWRSAMSGGRATVAAKKGESIDHVAGDICAVHEDAFPFVEKAFIECKHYKKLELQSVITTAGGQFCKFWKVAQEKAKQHNKVPVIIAKQNLLPILVGLDSAGVALFKLGRQLMQAYIPAHDLHIYSLKQFVEGASNEEFRLGVRLAPDQLAKRHLPVESVPVAERPGRPRIRVKGVDPRGPDGREGLPPEHAGQQDRGGSSRPRLRLR